MCVAACALVSTRCQNASHSRPWAMTITWPKPYKVLFFGFSVNRDLKLNLTAPVRSVNSTNWIFSCQLKNPIIQFNFCPALATYIEVQNVIHYATTSTLAHFTFLWKHIKTTLSSELKCGQCRCSKVPNWSQKCHSLCHISIGLFHLLVKPYEDNIIIRRGEVWQMTVCLSSKLWPWPIY